MIFHSKGINSHNVICVARLRAYLTGGGAIQGMEGGVDQLQGCLPRSPGLAACHPGDTLNGFSVQKAWIGSGRGSISDDAELGGQLRPGSSPEKLTKRGNYPGHMSSVFSLQQVCVARLRAILDVGLLEITIKMSEGRQGSLDWNWRVVGRRP